jgi:hypothetical protein
MTRRRADERRLARSVARLSTRATQVRGEGYWTRVRRAQRFDKRTHETSWEGDVGSCTAVDEDLSLLEDHHHFLVRKGVLQSVPEKDHQREGCTKLVWSS